MGCCQGKRVSIFRSSDARRSFKVIIYNLNLKLVTMNKALKFEETRNNCSLINFRLVLLALEDGSALSRKVLVMFVVQRLSPQFPHQASKTAIGHVIQLLYRASCFKVNNLNYK